MEEPLPILPLLLRRCGRQEPAIGIRCGRRAGTPTLQASTCPAGARTLERPSMALAGQIPTPQVLQCLLQRCGRRKKGTRSEAPAGISLSGGRMTDPSQIG